MPETTRTPPLPVVLDVDTGVDDALALLLAVRHPGLDLRAVSCVAGNVGVDQVVENTLRVLDAAGAPDVPVARGAGRPLAGPARPPRRVHGEDGLGDVGPARSSRRTYPGGAQELLLRTVVEAVEPLTLVALGPLTNVALLLRAHPEVRGRLARTVVMGGCAGEAGASPSTEFNVRADPEAAEVVLSAGLDLTLYGLDVFYDVVLTGADARALAASPDPAAALAGRLLLRQSERFGPDRAVLGDAGALAAALDPAGVTTRRLPVRVPPAGRRDGAPEADVVVGVDARRYRRLFLDALTGGGT